MNVEHFKNLRYSTALLESLSWDDSQLEALFEYLAHEFNSDMPRHPDSIAAIIKDNFGEQAANCFTSILKEVMVEYNLYFRGD